MIVAGTGHRPPRLSKEGYADLRLAPLLRVLCAEWLEPRAAEIACVISGMASGFDQALAWAAHDVGIPFKAYVPFKTQSFGWPEAARREYERLLSHASEYVIVSEGEYAAWKYLARDERMVDDASDVLALYDGHGKGGTYHTVRYSLSQNKPVHHLWKRFSEMGVTS